MQLFTIGFTKKSASRFFSALRNAGVRTVVDVRLNNRSQLAGFSKEEDLKYFLGVIGGIEYSHEPLLAPTQELLDRYRKDCGSWEEYAESFLGLIQSRKVEERLDPTAFDMSCLLCSEDSPERCHRRLVGEYLQSHWPEVRITHLK